MTDTAARLVPVPDDFIVRALATRLVQARVRAGHSRTQLAELTGLTPSRLWRCEQGRIHADEVDRLTAALDQLEAADRAARRPTNRRASRVELLRRIDAALAAVDAGRQQQSISGLRRALADVEDALIGSAPD